MSEPRPPSTDLPPIEDVPPNSIPTLTPISATDKRDIDMNQLDPSRSTSDPGVIHLTGPTKGTVVRQPDGSWTFVPEPPPVAAPAPPPPVATTAAPPFDPAAWSQPAGKVAGKSFLGGHGLMATLATLATVAIVGVVGVALVSGGNDGGGNASTVPPAGASGAPLSTPTGTLAGSPFPVESMDGAGAAEANRLVIETLKRCAREHGVTEQRLDAMGLTFEAVPGAIPEVGEGVVGDVYSVPFPGESSDLFTVTITHTASGAPYSGTSGRWMVNVKTGEIAPSYNGHGIGTAPKLYNLFIWCDGTDELGDDF